MDGLLQINKDRMNIGTRRGRGPRDGEGGVLFDMFVHSMNLTSA